MKFFITVLILIAGWFSLIYSQPWVYNFGESTGVFNIPGESETFLPETWTGGGRAVVAVGTGGGSFNLENPGIINFGIDTELRCVASELGSGNINKFSIIDYSPGVLATIKFSIRFTGGESGIWYFFNGRYASGSSTFSGTTSASGSEVFAGLRWEFHSDDSITTYYRNISAWSLLGNGNLFSKDQNYIIEIYSNNSGEEKTYTYNVENTLAPGSWDIWINGILAGNDLSKALMNSQVNINAFSFHGESSTGNVANVILDNIRYTNQIAENPLPVEGEITEVNDYNLLQNFPNPFNPSTSIRFTLPSGSFVNLSVYNVLGEKIDELINSEMAAGAHEIIYNNPGLTSGIYLYKLTAEKGISISRKMILIK